mgnify:CR=1 FL=1
MFEKSLKTNRWFDSNIAFILYYNHNLQQYVPENWNAHKGKSKDAQLHRAEEEAAENLIKQSTNIKG